MSCGCKKKKVGTQGELARGVNGYLALLCHDNGVPYAGERFEENVIAVGRLTVDERLFLVTDLAAASAYAQQVQRPLIVQPASLFPSEAIERLFEGLVHSCEEALV